VSDARLLAAQCDCVLFVVKWGETQRNVVEGELRALSEAGARAVAVVLNQVDVRQHARYGYTDSGAYHGRARVYYAD